MHIYVRLYVESSVLVNMYVNFVHSLALSLAPLPATTISISQMLPVPTTSTPTCSTFACMGWLRISRPLKIICLFCKRAL